MALKGELTDLSLAELIEFFCNQRKTGRLTVSYPHTHAYFYLQSGAVVHASVGSLRGIDAVYYALTQSNASFNFSTAYEAPAQTINQPWTSVVLEGLRRMDEGVPPRNPFPEKADEVTQPVADDKPEVSIVADSAVTASLGTTSVPAEPSVILPEPDHAHRQLMASPAPEIALPSELKRKDPAPQTTRVAAKEVKEKVLVSEVPPPAPAAAKVNEAFLSSAQHASKFSHTPWKLAAIFASLVLLIAAIAVPWGWRARGKTAKAAEPQSTSESAAVSQTPDSDSSSTSERVTDPQIQPGTESSSSSANPEAADVARRPREARAREEARLKAAAAAETATTPANQSAQPPAPSTSTKKVVVQVTYDENGRVTQATGNDPTALRIARQKRFPPGKSGSTTITIPIN